MRMISRFIKRLFILLCLSATLIGGMAFTVVPHKAKKQTIKTLERLGFEDAEIETTSAGFGRVILQNITLGEDKFSQIKEISLHYNPVTYLFLRRIRKMDIQEISLTGEAASQEGLSIAGWHLPASGDTLTMPDIAYINIRDSHIELLSENMGGIDLKFNAQIQKQDKTEDSLSIIGHISSAQKNLRFSGKIEGAYTPDKGLALNLSYEDGSIATPAIKFSRATGTADFAFTHQSPITVKSEFNAGGMTLHNLPWQGVTGSVEGGWKDFKILGTARATGNESLEMAFQIQKNETGIRAGGALYAQTANDMIAYLSRHIPSQGGVDVIAPISALGGQPDIYLDFLIENVGTDKPKNIVYRTRRPYDARGMINLSQGR